MRRRVTVAFRPPAGAVHSPSDLVVLDASEQKLRVAGRISRTSTDHLVLGDAWGGVVVVHDAARHDAAPPTQPGDFLEVEVERTPNEQGENTWRLIQVLSHVTNPEPRGDGETFRLGGDRAHLLVARSRVLAIIRRYFDEQGFLEVETPTFAVCPGLDAHVHSLAPVRWDRQEYHLITSPEFHMKRLLSGGLPRIFQIARCFRAEELGPLHQPEFTLLEWYRAFSGWESMLHDTESIVRRVFEALDPARAEQILGGSPFLRLTVSEAFSRFAQVSDAVRLAAQDPDTYFSTLLDRVEPALAELGVPVFLTHFPKSQASLARLCPSDPEVAERFELFVQGRELCNGFGELTDAAEQRFRFELERTRRQAAGEPVYPLDERFLSALDEGMPPAAGNALGVDRLVALATGAPDIASTLCFSHEER